MYLIKKKYKYLWGVEDKDCGSSYQEKVSQIYVLRLDYSRILSCIKKKITNYFNYKFYVTKSLVAELTPLHV